MRRVVLCLLVSFLVLAAQQAALVHAIGHGTVHGNPKVGASTLASTDREPTQSPQDSPAGCDKCFQFAHVAGAMAPALPQLLLKLPELDAPLAAQASLPVAVLLAARSRGPPTPL